VSTPRLSAILVSSEGVAATAATIRHLAEQTVVGDIELVLVTPEPDASALNDFDLDLDRFGGVKVASAGTRSNAGGYVAGIHAASADVVAICEDHSYPEPGWAEALLDGYAPDVAAVGPVLKCGNPRSAVSFADFLLGFGPWLAPRRSSDVEQLPGHSSSYRRDILLGYEPDLERWLDAESVLHWDLRRRGYRLHLTGDAVTHHFNLSRPTPWLQATYLQSRTFAGRRLTGKGPLQRLAWVLAVPLIPLVRLRRVIRDVQRASDTPPMSRLMPAVVVALLVSAVG
jgi:GT2 family glycosyltransferase